MSITSRKIKLWDGPNKKLARQRKSLLIRGAIEDQLIPNNPHVLSFAGTKAHFERSLVNRELTTADRIVTIQTCSKLGGHDGAQVLRKLIKLRNKELPGMRIWPSSFSSFSEGYNQGAVSIPQFEGRAPLWYSNPNFRKEMKAFSEQSVPPFDVIDADLCGIFSERNANDITRLFSSGAVADYCLLFVNHQKGRDGRFGQLFAFLRSYFDACPYFDAASFKDLDLRSEDKLSFWYVRFVLVPIYYICEAYDAGFMMDVARLVEYRDRNLNSRAGTTMLQWYFRLRKKDSVKLKDKAASKILQKSKQITERDQLEAQLSWVAREAYPYTEAVD